MFLDNRKSSVSNMLSFVVLDHSLFNSLQGLVQFIVLSFEVFSIFAVCLVMPLFLFLGQLSQTLSFGVSRILNKLFVLDFVFGLVYQSLQFVLGLCEISLFLFCPFISFQHLLGSFVQFLLFSIHIKSLLYLNLLLVLLCHCFILLNCFVFNFRLFFLSLPFTCLIVCLLFIFLLILIFRTLLIFFILFILCVLFSRLFFVCFFSFIHRLRFIRCVIFFRFRHFFQVCLDFIFFINKFAIFELYDF